MGPQFGGWVMDKVPPDTTLPQDLKMFNTKVLQNVLVPGITSSPSPCTSHSPSLQTDPAEPQVTSILLL